MIKHVIIAVGAVMILFACSISYKFNGASIDYNKVKSISVADFPIRAALVYAPLSQKFSEEMRDLYRRQTRLTVLNRGGDMMLEGEITRYDLAPMAVRDNSYASQTRLTIAVRVRFTNNSNHDEDFEETFSAFSDFNSDRMLTSVQDELVATIVKELTENIYNRTVANW